MLNKGDAPTYPGHDITAEGDELSVSQVPLADVRRLAHPPEIPDIVATAARLGHDMVKLGGTIEAPPG
jgi:hypothetical protein